MESDRLNHLRRAFRRFARVEARDLESPMYEELAHAISRDDDLLEIAAQTKAYQPPPNMLFAAVQFLLLSGEEHALSSHYPIIAGEARVGTSAIADFRDFCIGHREAVIEIIRSRRTQTNVVRRCTCLLPAFSIVSQESGLPLALIDIGASAGLNLNFDRYYYRYQSHGNKVVNWGSERSRIHLEAELNGSSSFPSLAPIISVASRNGIDLNPVDLTNPDQLLWLRSLIWPEHVERHQQLIDAASEFNNSDICMHAGDATEVLPGLMASIPVEHALVVYSTIALYQFPNKSRERLSQALTRGSENRPVWQIALEGSQPTLSLTRYRNGVSDTEILADASPHGWWIKWRV